MIAKLETILRENYGRNHDLVMTWSRSNCVTNDHGYVSFVVITIRSFPHDKSYTTGTTCGVKTPYPSGASELIPGFYWGSCCPVYSVPCNVLQIVVCPVLFLFGHCVVCPSNLWLLIPLWYIQAFHIPIITFVASACFAVP